ncbi:ferrous iron transporter FeoB [Chthonomonas calidirosea]|uniref:ferrous iron transport protein B n=1 Tax=Chthonomonas calidirosea TaxID=454171 RepID=UPI0006DD4DF9|nr:ferrous iron transport protein B [Chthonomonas calidirosea]CEK14366.1 ferrous iron transporter FeoB [Chthonomonas calidirosea]
MSSLSVETRLTGARIFTVAIIGNPNSGKTTLFNALTGLRQKVGNYPGVTVERKEGRVTLEDGTQLVLFDLPGLYSLTPHSPDELIAREVLLGLRADTPPPDVVLNVVDASNLERNLYLTSQLLDLGVPVVIALTMTDMVRKEGKQLDTDALERATGVPVVAVVAAKKEGLPQLLEALKQSAGMPAPSLAWEVPEEIRQGISGLQEALQQEHALDARKAFAEAVTLLMQESDLVPMEKMRPSVRQRIRSTREQLANEGIDFATQVIEARYRWIAGVCDKVLLVPKSVAQHSPLSFNERIDKVLMHPFWGYVIFFGLMAVVFQLIFALGQAPADAIKDGIAKLGSLLTRYVPAGDLRDLLNDGVLGGVGTTLSFLPQILLLFFFISLLEDTGYMARAAFLMDRLMSRVGLHGKSFIPLLSSFACAIPGILATRTIGDRKARLITILVAPLMSCSARLPVYLLMTSAFIPNRRVFGIGSVTLLTLPAATFIALYFLGMAAAFGMAWLFHKTLLKGVSPTFLMELPPYRLPSVKAAVIQMVERAGLFVRRAGTVILSVAIVVWFLSSYPKYPHLTPDQALQKSYLGQLGRLIEPTIRPLGFNWKMGAGIVSSFIAREVFVSTMGTIYNVADTDSRAGQADLGKRMQADIDPATGQHVFTPLVAVCLMIYYVLAMQCMSTVAVVRKETNGWKWPLFQIAYMTALAWIVTFAVYHVGLLFDWGMH